LQHKRGGVANADNYRKAYNYLAHRLAWTDYVGYRSQNLPIGSGVTEAACKTVFTQRLKQSGMSWDISRDSMWSTCEPPVSAGSGTPSSCNTSIAKSGQTCELRQNVLPSKSEKPRDHRAWARLHPTSQRAALSSATNRSADDWKAAARSAAEERVDA
jgi:hypothetical protein